MGGSVRKKVRDGRLMNLERMRKRKNERGGRMRKNERGGKVKKNESGQRVGAKRERTRKSEDGRKSEEE